MSRLIKFLKVYSLVIVIFTALCTIAFAVSLRNLSFQEVRGRFDLPDYDLEKARLAKFDSLFGPHEILLLVAEYDSLWGYAQLKELERLVSEIGDLDGVTGVLAPSTARRIHWLPTVFSYEARVGPLYPPSGMDVAEIERLRKFMMSEPAFAECIISRDGRSLAMAIGLRGGSSQAEIRTLVSNLHSILEKHPDIKSRLVGAPLIDIAFADIHRQDLKRFAPLSFLLVVVILFIFFRNWKPIALALLIAVSSLIWSLALLQYSGTPLSAGLAMIVPLVLVNSIAYSIHYLEYYSRHQSEGGEWGQKFSEMVKLMFWPSVLTGLTTAAGFFSLSVSALKGIEDLGLYLAAGILASTYLNSIFLVALLYRLKPSYRRPQHAHVYLSILSEKAGGFIEGHARKVLAGVGLIALLSFLGIARLSVDTNHLAYLRQGEKLREDFHFVDDNFGGIIPLEITIPIHRGDADYLLPELSALGDSLRAIDEIGAVVSIADFIDMAERTRPTFPGVAWNRSKAAYKLSPSFWAELDSSDAPARYVAKLDSHLVFRVSARLHSQGSEQLAALLSRIRGLVDRVVQQGTAGMTGLAVYFSRLNSYILESQIGSFGSAMFTTLLFLTILSGSWRLGLLALFANALPVWVTLGVMGWANIPLDISTVMVASVTLGIVVDDTIHFLYRYRLEMKGSCSPIEGIKSTFAIVGSPILIITVVLSAGFFAMAPSRFVPISYFGILSGLTVIVAVLGDMLMLPSLMHLGQNFLKGRRRSEPAQDMIRSHKTGD